ncbi:hypothetical protein H0H87_005046 [Tephrocybe sp. NHM501043]|nr:hypothetical protein H0H87_005046 [Tephrocybe sp. NHM501043]
MLVDMLAYAIDKPPPSTIILISGDRDFAYAVSTLRLRRYRVVIISLAGVHTSLKTQASAFLDWTNDVLGAEIVDDAWSPRSVPGHLQEDYRRTSHFQRENSSSTKNLTPFLRHGRRTNSEDADIDIMNHIRHNGNDAHNALDSGMRSRMNSETVKEIISYQPPNQPPSHDSEEEFSLSPTTRSPSRTESAPAALYMNDLSSTPTVVHKPFRIDDGTINESGGVTTPLPDFEAQEFAFGSIKPPTASENQVVIIGQNHQNIASLAAPSNTVLTSQSHSSPVPPKIQLQPAVPASLASNGNVTSRLSTPPVQQNPPKVVPPIFALLVQRLEFHRSRGFSRPFRSNIAVELATTDNTLYKRAGSERFGQYVALAEKAGIIELGGKEGGAWIALRSEWYNAKII